MGLAGIFNHDEIITICNFHNRIHLRRMAIKVNRKNGLDLSPASFCFLVFQKKFQMIGIHRVSFGIDIDEEEWDEEELVEAKKKGPARRLSKQEKRRQAVLKKL